MTLPAELLYSLPFDCPFEFSRVPAYPIAPSVGPELTLRAAYLDALYNPNLSIDWFARLVLSRLPSLRPDASGPALRDLILPLHQFDSKWRSITPGRLSPDSSDGPGSKALTKLSEEERARLVGAHREWTRVEALKRADRQEDERAAQLESEAQSLLKFGREEEDGYAGEEATGRAEDKLRNGATQLAKATSWTRPADHTDQDWIASQELLE